VFVRTSLFLDCTARNRIGGLVQFAVGAGDRGRHWIEAWTAAIRAAFKVRRLSACAVPEPCPSYPSSASAAPGLLAISSNIRFF
jgi:hypothetical protein